jgi:NAD(P)-dependent dehydrogenase (short-subunit alcohol dehydrogenase family)
VVDSVESVPDFTEFGRLDSRGAVVIGARQGIGRHTAHALRTAGAQVAVPDLNLQLAAELAAEVDGIAITAEVRKEADIQPADVARLPGAVAGRARAADRAPPRDARTVTLAPGIETSQLSAVTAPRMMDCGG